MFFVKNKTYIPYTGTADNYACNPHVAETQWIKNLLSI